MSDKTPPRDQLEPDEAPQPSPRISISARAYADLRSDIKFLRSDNADLRQHNHQLNSIVSDRGAPARVDPEPATAEALHPFLAAASGVQRPRPSMTGASIQTSSSELPRSSSAYSAAELLRGLGVVNKTQNNGPLSRTGSSVSNFGGASGSGSSRDKATVHFSNDCIYLLPWWGTLGQRIATDNFTPVLAQWGCILNSPSLSRNASADQVWDFVVESFGRFGEDLKTYSFAWCATSKQNHFLTEYHSTPGTPFYPTAADLERAYKTKQAYIECTRPSEPTSDPSSQLPPLRVAFQREVYQAPSGTTSTCAACKATMPKHRFEAHRCSMISAVKLEVKKEGKGEGSLGSKGKGKEVYPADAIVISSDEDDGRGHDDESSVRGGEKTKSSSASAGKGNNLKKKSNIVVARMAHKGKRGRANKGASKKKKAGGDGHEQEKVGEAEDMEDGEEEEISPKSMCPLCDRLIEVEYFSEVEDEPVMADEVMGLLRCLNMSAMGERRLYHAVQAYSTAASAHDAHS
ncbi:unnamed protein product [Tilletia caries]|nr:unnamed protein product [Tilletia caries]